MHTDALTLGINLSLDPRISAAKPSPSVKEMKNTLLQGIISAQKERCTDTDFVFPKKQAKLLHCEAQSGQVTPTHPEFLSSV